MVGLGWGQGGVQAGGVLTSVGLVGAGQVHLFACLLYHVPITHRYLLHLMHAADADS